MTCRHCRRERGEYSRKLCSDCFHDPDILKLYPAKIRTESYKTWPRGYEPTMEEVEAMIAEQLPTMPAWGPEDE